MRYELNKQIINSFISGIVFAIALIMTVSVVAYAQGGQTPLFQNLMSKILVNPNLATTNGQVLNAQTADRALEADYVNLEPLTISNGNIGIAKSNPSEKLDVNGNVIIRGNLEVTGNLLTLTGPFQNNVGKSDERSITLAPVGNNVCFLTEARNQGLNTENSNCNIRVLKEQDNWILRVRAFSNAQCGGAAMCFEW